MSDKLHGFVLALEWIQARFIIAEQVFSIPELINTKEKVANKTGVWFAFRQYPSANAN